MFDNSVKDMTKGKEFPLLIKFMIPMLIGNIFQQLYNMVDSVIVGKYVGSKALGAVGATNSLTWLFFALCQGLAMGVGVMISQYFGAKDDQKVKHIIANSLYIATVSGLLMSMISVVFARPILEFLHTPKGIIDDSVLYMQIVCASTIVVAVGNAVSCILQALGDSKTPLIILMAACVVNVVLDIVLVKQAGMGVAGVAIATSISQAGSTVACLWFAFRHNPYFQLEKEHWNVEKAIITRCMKIGVPIAAQNSLIAISCVILQSVANGFGETVVAAYTATSRVEQLVQQPFSSLGNAISTFAGQNVGAGYLDRVKKAYRQSFIVALLFSILMFVLAHLGGYYIIQFFVDNKHVIEYGTKALSISSCFYFPLGLIYISRGLLNGTGDNVFAMINGGIEVACRVIFSSTLILIPVIGVWGVWYSSALTWLVTGTASYLRYKQGKWMNKSIVVK